MLRWLLPWLGALVFGGIAHAERNDELAWFNSLGFPNVSEFPFVEIHTGQTIGSEGEKPPYFEYGFLLHEDGDGFEVLTLDLQRIRYHHITDSFSSKAFHQAGDLEKKLREAAAVEPVEDSHRSRAIAWGMRHAIPQRTSWFVLAWIAHETGHDQWVEPLYRKAEESLSGDDDSLRASIAEELAEILLWRAILSFGEPKIPWEGLLADFEQVIAHFPDSKHHHRAVESAELLRRMIAEEKERPALTEEQIEVLPLAKQIDEWIFRLREQHGEQWSQPGGCDIFIHDVLFHSDGLERQIVSPAAHLVEIGYSALPALIEALDDERFTRSVQCGRSFAFTHTVLRYSDCSQRILWEITGQSFRGASAKEEALNWWDAYQILGERELLIRDTKRGVYTSIDAAKTLLERHPYFAVTPILEGAAKMGREGQRAQLFRLLHGRKEQSITEFLRKELADGPYLSDRITAARMLWLRGDRERPNDAMLQAWAKIPPEEYQRSNYALGRNVEKMIAYLLACDSPDAVRSLRQRWKGGNGSFRTEVLMGLWDNEIPNTVMFNPARKPPLPASPTVAGAVEEFLAFVLLDETPLTVSGGSRNKRYSNPRACDIALEALADRWPDRYQADVEATFKDRERLRYQGINTWRLAQQLEPIPMPAFREVSLAEPNSLRPWLLELRHAEDGGSAHLALTELESMGLPALPALAAETEKLVETHARQIAQEAVMRLANRVEQVTIVGDQPVNASWIQAALQLKGQPLTGTEVDEVLRAYASDTTSNASRIRLRFVRHADLSGIDVLLTIYDSPVMGKNWRGFEESSPGLSGGTFSKEDYAKGHARRVGVIRAYDNVLAYPPDKELTVRSDLSRG